MASKSTAFVTQIIITLTACKTFYDTPGNLTVKTEMQHRGKVTFPHANAKRLEIFK